MKFKKFSPHPSLAKGIAYYWTLSSTVEEWGKQYRFIPDNYVEWIFHLKQPWEYRFANRSDSRNYTAHLLGHFKKHMDLVLPEGPFHMFGVKFFPTTAHLFWKMDMKETTGEYIAMSDLKDRELRELVYHLRNQENIGEVIQIMDQFLLKRLSALRFNDLAILTDRLDKDDATFSLDDFSVSPRRIEQRFQHEIGISPKIYQRTLRINKVINHMLHHAYPNLTALAYDFNYTDQSHFIRDFKQFTGIAPSIFLKRTQPNGDIFNLTL